MGSAGAAGGALSSDASSGAWKKATAIGWISEQQARRHNTHMLFRMDLNDMFNILSSLKNFMLDFLYP